MTTRKGTVAALHSHALCADDETIKEQREGVFRYLVERVELTRRDVELFIPFALEYCRNVAMPLKRELQTLPNMDRKKTL